jgi:hypothetical protein
MYIRARTIAIRAFGEMPCVARRKLMRRNPFQSSKKYLHAPILILDAQINSLLSISSTDDLIDWKAPGFQHRYPINAPRSSKIVETILLIEIFLPLLRTNVEL